jgi:hypothetical protein
MKSGSGNPGRSVAVITSTGASVAIGPPQAGQTITSSPDAAWRRLYQLGGIASLTLVLITLAQFVVFVASPPPLAGTASDWFKVFQANALLGLLSFELLMVVYTILSIPLSLALFIALRRVDPALTAIYVVLCLVGVVCFIAARPAFEMLALSGQYATATTDAQRSVLLAAGESMVAAFHGTAFYASYVLGSIGGLIISTVMLRGNVFGKTTAWLRIASSVLDFGLFVPGFGTYISIFSVVFLAVWNVLVARRLLQLGRGEVIATD